MFTSRVSVWWTNCWKVFGVDCIHSSYFQGADNKEYSSMLHKALEGAVMLHTFPKTTVDVFALVLESGGSMILF